MYKKIIFFIFSSILFKNSFAMISKVPTKVTAKVFCFLLNPEDLGEKYGQKYDYGKKLFKRLAELELLNKFFLEAANYYKETYFFGEDKKLINLSKQDKRIYNTFLYKKILKRIYKIVDDRHRGKNFMAPNDVKDLAALFICIKNKIFEKEIINIIKTAVKDKYSHESYYELYLSLTSGSGVLEMMQHFVEHEISDNSVKFLLLSLSKSAKNGNLESLKLSINKLKKVVESKINGDKQALQEKSLGEILRLCSFSNDDYLIIKGYIGIGFVEAFLNNYENVTNMLEKELGSPLINAGISLELFEAAKWGKVEIVKKILERYCDRSIYSDYYMWDLKRQCKQPKTFKNSHVCLDLIKKWQEEYELWAKP